MRKVTTFGWMVTALVIVAISAVPVMAATVVIPNGNTNVAGPSNNAFPFNAGSPMRHQQVYLASQFGGLTGVITQLAFRVDEAFGNPFNTNVDTEVRHCHTAVGPNGMSTTFANNYGGDVTLVVDGVINISSAGNPNVFDILVNLNPIFVYTGAQNLLVEIKTFSNATSSQFDSAGTGLGNGGTPWTDRLWAFGSNAVTGSSEGDDGYVTRFTIESATPVAAATWGGIKAAFRNP